MPVATAPFLEPIRKEENRAYGVSDNAMVHSTVTLGEIESNHDVVALEQVHECL